MILAGGKGSRLGVLTKKLAKPAVPFGSRYRIIDFTLSNCANSNIDTVGVLTQYQPFVLNSYIGVGSPWNLNRNQGGVFILPPYVNEKGGEWYKGTANAIYQNIGFIEQYNPDYVLILSGDHIYKMDYSMMLDYHKEKKADVTVSVVEVPWKEASRFGIMNTAQDGSIKEFEEKPGKPKNNLASMGIYIFNWKTLKKYLEKDEKDTTSSNDFGKDIIPTMLNDGISLFAYPFKRYWKDVGTIESFWEANMDLLSDNPALNLYDPHWNIYAANPPQPPNYFSATAKVKRSLMSDGCLIFGEVEKSILFPGVYIGTGAKVKNSIIMPNARIEENVIIENAIIGEKTIVGKNSHIGFNHVTYSGYRSKKAYLSITVVGENIFIAPNTKIIKGAVIDLESDEVERSQMFEQVI